VEEPTVLSSCHLRRGDLLALSKTTAVDSAAPPCIRQRITWSQYVLLCEAWSTRKKDRKDLKLKWLREVRISGQRVRLVSLEGNVWGYASGLQDVQQESAFLKTTHKDLHSG
jgi:hypothetical protein